MARSTADVLRDAKGRIDKPEKWVQRRPKYGKRECADQALHSAIVAGLPSRPLTSRFERKHPARLALVAAAQFLGFAYPAELNDKTNHPTVMRMYDRAIELAEEA